MRQINNIFDIQQVTKDLQDQAKKIAVNVVTQQSQLINPGKFFIANETGANNAIQAGLPVALVIGIEIRVLLAHTLHAGANTFNSNPIKSHFNNANNITNAYSVGSIIQLCWDGVNWQDLSQ